MDIRYKKIHCKLKNPKGRICNAYLGDLQVGKAVTVHWLCRNHKPSKVIEFTQSVRGVLTYREVPHNEQKTYDDDNVRISDG